MPGAVPNGKTALSGYNHDVALGMCYQGCSSRIRAEILFLLSLEIGLRAHIDCFYVSHFDHTKRQSRAEEHVPQGQGNRIGESRKGQNPFIVHDDSCTEENPQCHIPAAQATKVAGMNTHSTSIP